MDVSSFLPRTTIACSLLLSPGRGKVGSSAGAFWKRRKRTRLALQGLESRDVGAAFHMRLVEAARTAQLAGGLCTVLLGLGVRAEWVLQDKWQREMRVGVSHGTEKTEAATPVLLPAVNWAVTLGIADRGLCGHHLSFLLWDGMYVSPAELLPLPFKGGKGCARAVAWGRWEGGRIPVLSSGAHEEL